MFGAADAVGSTEGLPFSCKVLQCACQGDAKTRGSNPSLFTGTGAPRAAKPCVRQSHHPANSVGWINLFRPLPGSLQDTNLGSSKFPIYLRTIFLANGIFVARVKVSQIAYCECDPCQLAPLDCSVSCITVRKRTRNSLWSRALAGMSVGRAGARRVSRKC
jgi:hypothetical protein